MEVRHRNWRREPPEGHGTRLAKEGPRGPVRDSSGSLSDAGLDTLDWIASLGLPVEEFRDDDDPSAEEIQTRMEARMDAMWAQEDAWLGSTLR